MIDERIKINREIAQARLEITPQPLTIAALAELETIRDLDAFRSLKSSSFGPRYPAMPSRPVMPSRRPENEFDATGKLAQSERVHERRFVLLTEMSAIPISAASLVASLGKRYSVHCTGSPIEMAAQDLAYLKKIRRVEKTGGCRHAMWVRVR